MFGCAVHEKKAPAHVSLSGPFGIVVRAGVSEWPKELSESLFFREVAAPCYPVPRQGNDSWEKIIRDAHHLMSLGESFNCSSMTSRVMRGPLPAASARDTKRSEAQTCCCCKIVKGQIRIHAVVMQLCGHVVVV